MATVRFKMNQGAGSKLFPQTDINAAFATAGNPTSKNSVDALMQIYKSTNQKKAELQNTDYSNYSEQFKQAKIEEGNKALEADARQGYEAVSKSVSDARDAAQEKLNRSKYPGRFGDAATKQTAAVDEQTARVMPLGSYKPAQAFDSFVRSRKIDAASALAERVASDTTLQDHAPTAGVPSYAEILGQYNAQTGVSLQQQILDDLELAVKKVARVKAILTSSGLNEATALIQIGLIAQATAESF